MKIGIFDHLCSRVGGSQYVIARIAMKLSEKYEVKIIHFGNGYKLSDIEAAFNLDLGNVKEQIITEPFGSFSILSLRSLLYFLKKGLIEQHSITANYDLFIYSGHEIPPVSFAKQSMVYCHFPFQGSPKAELSSLEKWRKRNWLGKTLRMSVFNFLWMMRMRRYCLIMANSHFTASWIKSLWAYPAEVIYPPVTIRPKMVRKENIIVSIGRIVDTDRKKIKDQLLAFPEFVKRTKDMWQLVIIGFCADLTQDHAYLKFLKKIAKDMPVKFVINADRETLIQKLSQAKLFWHTAGLGEKESIEARFMEHFGIATVEAMMAGCVPLVPNCGGQPEIVDNEISGFVCRDFNSLVENSVRLANNEKLFIKMSKSAKECSEKFRTDVFDKQIEHYVIGSLKRGMRYRKHSDKIFS